MKANIINPSVMADSHKQALIALDQLDMKPGDIAIIGLVGRSALYISCPVCGVPSFTDEHHQITSINGKLSVNPQLQMQCCGWTGLLKDNEFVK
jgi:hypothetical protein